MERLTQILKSNDKIVKKFKNNKKLSNFIKLLKTLKTLKTIKNY